MRMDLEQKISVIANTKKILKQIRINDVGRPVFYTFPEKVCMKLTQIRAVPATSAGEIAEDIRCHLSECSRPGIRAYPMGASIAAESFMSGTYSYKNTFSFADSTAEGADIVNLPSRQAVVAVCRESDGDVRQMYKKIIDFLVVEKKRLCSDVYCLSIVNVIDPHEERKYLKYIFAAVQ